METYQRNDIADGYNDNSTRLNIMLLYCYWRAETYALDLLHNAEDQNQYALELDLVIMNTVLMNRMGINQRDQTVIIHRNHWTRDSLYVHDDIIHVAARTRLYIAQEYIRQMVYHGEPICTILDRLHALFERSRPCVMLGTRHIRRIGSTIPW